MLKKFSVAVLALSMVAVTCTSHAAPMQQKSMIAESTVDTSNHDYASIKGGCVAGMCGKVHNKLSRSTRTITDYGDTHLASDYLAPGAKRGGDGVDIDVVALNQRICEIKISGKWSYSRKHYWSYDYLYAKISNSYWYAKVTDWRCG